MVPATSAPDANFQAFLADANCSNHWIRYRDIEVYVRKSQRGRSQDDATYLRPCIDVANWGVRRAKLRVDLPSVKARVLLQLVGFMREVERAAVREGYAGVYVANVCNQDLQHLLQNHGYLKVWEGELWGASYYRAIPQMLAKSWWVGQLRRSIHSIQRPSLKAFASDPSLHRFWIQIQKSALNVLIEREWLGPRADPRRRRLTIQRIRGRVVHAEDAHDSWLYLEDDGEVIESLLAHVMRCFSGVTEIALSEHAVWTGHRRTTVGPERPHPRQCEWLAEMGFALERSERWARGQYVKRLG